ncbi:MAG TPA: SpoIIE family protein phosphatase [Candidatus Sulfopaludibacter sp.]|jgi:serine phosphatase RsbU (regulator of sigma subunit)|nr:SpoIIE family protein phosphatase [Candidatus Sulfopaludibacter sp.]
MNRELLIQCPDGQMKTVPLLKDRISVGRSSAAELCFPEDAGLSRQHFAFEPEADDWTVQDLGSKNGTFVNNIPLKARLILTPGDRITAGHLVIVYSPDDSKANHGVVVFEGIDSSSPSTSTVVTSLEGALSNQTLAFERVGPKGSAPLQALIRAGQELSENRPLEELFQVILDLAIQAVNAQRGVLLALEGEELVPRAYKGEGFRISTAVRDRVLKEKSSVLVRDAQLDDAFKGRMSIVEQKVHTMMAVPLQTKDRIIGLIYVDSPFVLREFTKDDLNLLTVMASICAVRIENARLALVEEGERIMRRDLSQAADIQRGMLPENAPTVEGTDLAGFNVPCRTVGGDYYGFFPYSDGRLGLTLGDVSGKGMPASLMMMALHARVQVLAEDPGDLGAFMARLNKTTCANCPSNRFITFFFCVLDTNTGVLTFANAGHNPPIIIRASGAAEMLEGGGPVLGILPIAPYRQMNANLERGDMLVIYSDGVTEATNTVHDEFDEQRFIEVLQQHREEPASEIVNAVTKALTEFAAGAPQADDITLLVAKRV